MLRRLVILCVLLLSSVSARAADALSAAVAAGHGLAFVINP